MGEWRRQRQREADEIVLLTADDIDVPDVSHTSSSSATQATPASLPSTASLVAPNATTVIVTATDPDNRYQTDDDSTRASLLAFAEFEGKLRAKQAIKHITPTTSTAAHDTAPQPAARTPQPATPHTDNELMASSMDAFAALELQLAKKKLQHKHDYLSDPFTHTTQQTVTTADQPAVQLTVLTAPRMPEPQECCGMSCPNCVSDTSSGHTLFVVIVGWLYALLNSCFGGVLMCVMYRFG